MQTNRFFNNAAMSVTSEKWVERWSGSGLQDYRWTVLSLKNVSFCFLVFACVCVTNHTINIGLPLMAMQCVVSFRDVSITWLVYVEEIAGGISKERSFNFKRLRGLFWESPAQRKSCRNTLSVSIVVKRTSIHALILSCLPDINSIIEIWHNWKFCTVTQRRDKGI